MFGTNVTSIQDAVAQLKNTQDRKGFDSLLCGIRKLFKTLEIDPKFLMELEQRAYYPVNEYSDRENQANLDAARKRVIEYLEQTMDSTARKDQLLLILENFYLFLENLLERATHKRGGIQKEHLENLKIRNEYDVQHLLYAYLKPLYPMERAEVSEDTGYCTVRTDIFLDSDHVIEVKCTRSTMNLKRLTEEIEADMVHYSAKHIYFFLYDKEKLIENPYIYKKTYENKVAEKDIHIIIHQPKIL